MSEEQRSPIKADNSGQQIIMVPNHSPLTQMLAIVALLMTGLMTGLWVSYSRELSRVERELRLVQAYLSEVNASLLEAGLIKPGSSALLKDPQKED